MDYSFLKNLTLIDTGRTRTPKEKNPKGMTVRVFANGTVFPSQELVDKYALEYGMKDDVGSFMGIDVIDSTEWTPLKDQPRMIVFGFVPKSEPKIDLFGTCRYNEDGSPKSSVMSQGTTSEVLLNLVRSMGYLTPDQKYVDLTLVEEYPLTTNSGIAYVPKTIEKGVNAGQKTYTRRENVTFYPVTAKDVDAKTPGSEVTITEATNALKPAVTI